MKRRHIIPATAAVLYAASQAAQAQSLQRGGDMWRLTVGSCANQKIAQPIWQTILSDKPDFHIFGGDNVYASDRPWSLAQLQEAYALAAKQEGMAQLMRSVPFMAMWDDHDYGFNDSGAEFEGKQAAKLALLDFFKYPENHATRTREGLYDARILGEGQRRIQIITLDTRWFRSTLSRPLIPGLPGQERYIPDSSPEKTMLGEAQWQWLEAQLKIPAQIRLIYSGIQVLALGHGWERWGNLPLERQRLLDTIARTKAQGVILLSGDRHIGALYKENIAAPYPLWEMTSSGLTHAWANASEAGPNRIGQLVRANHYGLVAVNWAKSEVQLQLKDTQGRSLHAITIPMKDLQS
ncbi:alkaline phosphatase D family protein [Variovorax sp. PCZ-1]|uniref:alkaline phosphatase D family protein n=1 Tax=Variovorax sp. PCZ-1 TaxID=2835533 RepID=UPI001BCD81C4|nr:alkaline phosphatase D family protein [Variovorax sp. PCZ-1]MBS7806972.1 alkaline phosphatase family protein [Variovorax sp. PCZ-1]